MPEPHMEKIGSGHWIDLRAVRAVQAHAATREKAASVVIALEVGEKSITETTYIGGAVALSAAVSMAAFQAARNETWQQACSLADQIAIRAQIVVREQAEREPVQEAQVPAPVLKTERTPRPAVRDEEER